MDSTVNESVLGIAARVTTGAGTVHSGEIPILRQYLESFLDPRRLVEDIGNYKDWGKEN